jgi:hypothetical protein
VRPSIRVLEYGHLDIAAAEAEDSLWPVPRKAGQLEEEGRLDMISIVGILLLCCDQVRLHGHCEVLDIYNTLLTLLSRDTILFRQLLQHLDNK